MKRHKRLNNVFFHTKPPHKKTVIMQKKIPPMIDNDQTVFMLTLQKRHTVFGASTTAIFILGGETEVKYHSNPL